MTPVLTSTVTPNTSMEFNQRKLANAARPSYRPMADEIVERLLPKIFDDVQAKRWKDFNSNIDTSVALAFFKIFYEEPEETDDGPLDIMYLFSAQKQRVDDLIDEVTERVAG